MKSEVISQIVNGKLAQNRTLLKAILEGLEGEWVKITVEPTHKRSTNQNSLYWLYIDIIRKDLGYSKENCHEILKYKFLLTEITDESTGEIIKFVRSTTDLSKKEFIDFIDSIIQWSWEYLKIELPIPEKNIKLNLTN